MTIRHLLPQAAVAAFLVLVTVPQGAHGAARASRAVASNAPVSIYAGIAGVGLFKSAGLGGPWQGPGSLPSDVLALGTADPAHWRTVYAGLRSGVYASHDGGTTWTAIGPRNHSAMAIVVDTRNANVIVAGTEHGIFRSTDGGATWSAAAGPGRAITALAQVPAAPTIYATAGGRVWRSADDGASWRWASSGLPANLTISDIAIGVVPATTTVTVYLATTQGLYLSTGGAWARLRGLPARSVSGVVAAGADVYAVTSADATLYTSLDAGATWKSKAIAGLTGGLTALAIDSQQPALLVAGDANGDVGYSTDGGTTWNAPSGTVAGTVGSPVSVLAVVQRQALPVDGVSDPHRSDVQWFPANGGHTLRGAFLDFWQAQNDAAGIIGYPATEPFTDQQHGGVTAQYFDRMELLLKGSTVTPAPLGAEQAPATYTGSKESYSVDPRFQSFWSANGGAALFGPAVTPAFEEAIGDGSGRTYVVQYFRNARLEYHPEVPAPGEAVQVGLLGQQALQALGWSPSF